MRKIVLGVPAALVLVVSQIASAASIVDVSGGPSPFSACTPLPAAGGTNYLNTEVEPWLAANPANPSNLIAVYQQDRWSNGGARGLVAASSSNGGATWSSPLALPFDVCAGDANYERATDPWVSIGVDGTAYAVGLSFNVTDNDNAVAAVVSTDGGASWHNKRYIMRDDDQFQFFNDKESVTADPVIPGTAYAVWDRLVGPTNNQAVQTHNFFGFTGPAWFSKTTDGGSTWSAPKIIVPTGQRQQTIDNQIVVDPRSGVIYNFFNLILFTGPNAGPNSIAPHGFNLAFVKSTDGGTTWSAPKIVTHMNPVTVRDPNTGAAMRTHDFGGAPVVDSAGRLYLVWQDGRFTGGQFAQVLLTTSNDGGQAWTSPAVVSGSPATTHAFLPTIATDSNRNVGIYYYDFRNLAPGNTSTLPTDVWFRVSPPGGAAFSAETHIAGSFNMLAAADAAGFFLGDYAGMAATGTTFHLLFGETNCNTNACSATAHPNGSPDPNDVVTTSAP
jgi:hypothetical protein